MNWTAIVPLKARGSRKTRLGHVLSPGERDELGEALLARVLAALDGCPFVARTLLLSDRRPCGWEGELVPDLGRGLNAELAAAVAAGRQRRIAVFHADLPLLTPRDVSALLFAAGDGSALAPDRHGRGTNAIAVNDADAMRFSFGADSFRLHREGLEGPNVVQTPGLALDVDVPADLGVALAAGFSF